MSEARRSTPALEVKGLDVYYGQSHALQGVDITLPNGVFSVVGRNGMGKTTLCKAIMGLVRTSSGSVRIRGEEATGLSPARIARLGVGYVPQGRRLWRSLSVNEHLQLAAGMRRGPWTIERIYETFPRLGERKDHGGSQLSGGEQQMLAISRALLTNPHLLIMDEPTEGLAPVIVAQVQEMLVRLGEDGDMSVLVIEQNIGVATAISRNVAIMVNGRVNRIIDSARLAADRDLQQRLLGVGLHGDLGSVVDAGPVRPEPGDAPQPARSKGQVRIFISNPVLPTRWSQPVPIARIEAAARTVTTGVTRLEEVARQRREPATSQTSGPPVVLVVGTLDTKGAELRFIRDIVAKSGLRTRLVDVSTSGKASACDVSAQEIALNHGRGGSAGVAACCVQYGPGKADHRRTSRQYLLQIELLRDGLRLMAIASFIVLAIWLISPPISLPMAANPTTTGASGGEVWLPTRLAWLGIISAGILGAVFSGFSSSITSDRKKTRIPSELSSTTVTIARLSMAVSSISARTRAALSLPGPSPLAASKLLSRTGG